MSKSSSLKYRNDNTTRLKVLNRVKEQHRKYSGYKIYDDLIKTRKQEYNIKESIRIYQEKLKKLKRRLEWIKEKKQVLAIEWKEKKKNLTPITFQ